MAFIIRLIFGIHPGIVHGPGCAHDLGGSLVIVDTLSAIRFFCRNS